MTTRIRDKDHSDKSSTRSGSKKKKHEEKKEEELPGVIAGWTPLKPLSDQQMDKEVNTTLAGMLPFRAPPLNPQRVLVDTTAGLREGHGAQDHVVRDFDTRFMKTSTGSPLFTSGIFLKPPTLPGDENDPSREKRKKLAAEDEYKKRGLDNAAAAADGEDSHMAMELAQFTFNKFDLSRQAARRDKASEIQSLKGVDPSRIQQLLAHNIRSQAPAPIAEPVVVARRSNVKECRKTARPLDVKPDQVLPSSPVQHYFSLPGRPDPIAPYSFIADRLDDIYQPLPFVFVAKGNSGDNNIEAPLVLNPSPPETHLHVPGKESSYFSVPATPPTLSLGAPRENPQEKMRRATHKEIAARPIPLAPSTPPEASFFVPTREIPAMPRTHEPKTAGFGSFVATPVQEKLNNDHIKRHRGGDGSTAFPTMLLPRTPAELNFEAPPGSELAKKLGNNKEAHRDDMFSVPANPMDSHKAQDKLSTRKEAELGPRPKPVLPRTPAETKLTLPMRDSTGAQLPPAGQFFSVPATPPDSVLLQQPVPNTVRSRRQEDTKEAEFDMEAIEKVALLVDAADQASRENGLGALSPEQRQEKEQEIYDSIYRNKPPQRTDFGADDAPHVHLPPTPPETKSLLPTFTVTNTLTNKLMKTLDSASRSASNASSTNFSSLSHQNQNQKIQPNVSVLSHVFGTPATPITAPIQPELVDYHQKNPLPEEPRPILPPTPLENQFTLPILDRQGTENETNQSINFSVPPTPPRAPLVFVPPIQKKLPNEGQPNANRTILPPTPVDPRLEPLPPTKGIDMEHEVENAKKAQVFSLPATPPDARLPQVSKLLSKQLEKEERTAAQDKEDNDSLVSDTSLSELPPALKIQMREMMEQEKNYAREEKQADDKREGAKPILPHTPPELSYSIPPRFEIKRGGNNDKNAAASRSDSAASSVFTSVSQRPSRSESINISVTSPSGNTVSKHHSGTKLNNNNPNEKPQLSGEFFSVPATPPGGNKPLVTIIRKQGQSETRGVIDSKPVIPSTPPDDFFTLPNKTNNTKFSSVIHFPPSSPGGTGGGISSPSPQQKQHGSPSSNNRTVVQEENRFFSLTSTPPSASAPLVLSNRNEMALPLSPSAKKQQADEKFLETGATPQQQEERKKSLSDFPPKLPTPQELTWGVPGIPDSPAKAGYDPKKDAAARERREKYVEEYEARKSAEADAEEKRKLEMEMKALEARERQLQREAEAQKRQLTPDEAAVKIQSLQRQRMARAHLGQLKENKLRAEKLKENEIQQAKLEAELKQLEAEEQSSAATKIQTLQRQRAAKRELERLRLEKAREHEEAENEKKIATLENQIESLQKRQQFLADRAKREGRPLSDVEQTAFAECAQEEQAAKEQLQHLKHAESARQKSVAENSKQDIDKLEQEKKLRQAELAAAAADHHHDSDKTQALKNEIENLEREIDNAQKEHAAFAAAANATRLEAECSKLKLRVDDKEKELQELKKSFAGRPITEEEKLREATLEKEIHELKQQLEAKLDEQSEADEDWRNREAVVDASRAQDQVAKLEDEVKRLQDEERELEETSRSRDLTPEEAAKKIQCLQRQRLARQELERRKAVADERQKEVQRTKVESELGTLRRQEELFVEKERDGIPLAPEESTIREQNKKRVKELETQLRVLNYVQVRIDPKNSHPSTPPSQCGLPAQLPQSLSKMHTSMPPSTSAITSNNLAGPLPPTPPEVTHNLPIPQQNNNNNSNNNVTYFQSLPLGASLPAGSPGKPLRSQIHRHPGSDSPREINPVLPHSPADESGTLDPNAGMRRKGEPLLAEVLEQHDAATKIQSVQRQRIARQELAKKRQEAADKAKKDEDEAAETLRKLEEEQRKLEETARGRDLTPDEAARRIQCLQRQRIARKELENRKQIAATRKAELDAAKAQNDEADAEEKLRQLEEEQKALDSIARTRSLTEDEAARKIQCLQRQRIARKELENRKQIAAAKQAQASARKADEEIANAEENLRQLEEEQKKLEETARSRELTPDEAARKIQCLQRQRLARQELERRKLIAAEKQREADRIAALPVPGVDPREALLNNFSSTTLPPSHPQDPGSEAQQIARRTVRDAAEESDRHFLYDNDQQPQQPNNTNNNSTNNRNRVFVVPPEEEDDRRSLPGLDHHHYHHHHGERRLSNASSNLQGPSRRPPENTNINNNNNTTNNTSAIRGPTTPVIIRRGGGGSGNNSTSATPVPQNLSPHPNNNSNNNNSSTFIVNPNTAHNFAIEESPAPRPLQHGHVIRSVADSMPHAETLHQFAAQLEVYFSTFDVSQMENIRSIAPAYRNRQRELWDFLKDRYESGMHSVYNNNSKMNINNVPPPLPPTSTVSASPSIRVPPSSTTNLNVANNSQNLPQLTPAMQRLIQQNYQQQQQQQQQRPVAPIVNDIGTTTPPSSPIILNRTVTPSQIPNATSSRIILPSSNASATNLDSNAAAAVTPVRNPTNQQNTTTTPNFSTIHRDPNIINNANNNNNSSSSAVAFASPSPITIIRRTGSGNNSSVQNNNNNSNQTTPTPTKVIGEDIVMSERRPSTLVEDLAMSEILKMLRDKK